MIVSDQFGVSSIRNQNNLLNLKCQFTKFPCLIFFWAKYTLRLWTFWENIPKNAKFLGKYLFRIRSYLGNYAYGFLSVLEILGWENILLPIEKPQWTYRIIFENLTKVQFSIYISKVKQSWQCIKHKDNHIYYQQS